MEKSIKIKIAESELFIGDIDQDNEIKIGVTSLDSINSIMWIEPINLYAIKDHIDYLISKLENNG
jgi:hypothetical protein